MTTVSTIGRPRPIRPLRLLAGRLAPIAALLSILHAALPAASVDPAPAAPLAEVRALDGQPTLFVGGRRAPPAWYHLPGPIDNERYIVWRWVTQTFVGPAEDLVYAWDPGSAQDPGRSLRMTHRQAERSGGWVLFADRTPIDATRTYRFHARTRTEGASGQSGGVRLWVRWNDAAGNPIGDRIVSPFTTTGGSWAEISTDVLSPPPGTVGFWLIVNQEYFVGDSWTKDIRVEDVTDQRIIVEDQVDESLVAHYARTMMPGSPSVHLLRFSLRDLWLPPAAAGSPGRLDLALARFCLQELRAANPAAKAVIQIDMDAPEWWLARHPDDVAVMMDGAGQLREQDDLGERGQSMASAIWRSDASQMLTSLIAELRLTSPDQVIGYMPCGGQTDEWIIPGGMPLSGDFSPAMLARFRQFLAQRYADDRALQIAWNDASVTLANAAIPLRRDRVSTAMFLPPESAGRVRDYYECQDQAVSEAILQYCSTIKAAPGPRLLAGAFHGYTLETSAIYSLLQQSGHAGQEAILASPDIDFLAAPSSYHLRSLGRSGGTMSLADSVRLHGKLWFQEEDVRTHLTVRGEQTELNLAGVASLADALGLMKRELAMDLVKGLGLWWYDLAGGGWYDDPAYRAFIAQSRDLAGRAQALDRSSVSEILVVVDEVAPRGQPLNDDRLFPDLLRNQLEELSYVGAPFDVVRSRDLPFVTRPYKLVLFLDTFDDSPAIRDFVSGRRLAGATLVWFYAPGRYRADGTLAGMTALTGIDFVERTSAVRPIVVVTSIDDGLMPLEPSSLGARYGSVDSPTAISPVFVPTDPAAHVIGVIEGTSMPGLVVKAIGTSKSVFSMAPKLDHRVIAALARSAGVHLLIAPGANTIVQACRSLISVHAKTAGAVTIDLGSPCDLSDFVTGAAIASGVTTATIAIEDHGTAILQRTEVPTSAVPRDRFEYTIDNVATEVWIDGVQAAPGANAADWAKSDVIETPDLSCVAIRGDNAEPGTSWAGFLAKATLHDGRTIVSDGDWRVFAGEAPAPDASGRAWTDPRYDDSSWHPASVAGPYGMNPWHSPASLDTLDGASWIWAGDYAHGISPVFLRRQFQAVVTDGVGGLFARYYPLPDFQGPAQERIDPRIAFDWGLGRPHPLIGEDRFSVRWTGEIEAPASGVLRIATLSDDGIRVAIDGARVIDDWTDHEPTLDTSGAIAVVAGNRYPIAIDYHDSADGAVAKLYWSMNGQMLALVPTTALYPVRPDRFEYTIDNVATEVWIDGALNAPGVNATDWSKSDVIETANLSCVAIRADNAEPGASWAGFLAKATLHDGRTIVSDGDWRVFAGAAPAPDVSGRVWTDPQYDDSAWDRASVAGPYGMNPWHSPTSLSALDGASWIWAGDYAHGVSPVYLRRRFGVTAMAVR